MKNLFFFFILCCFLQSLSSCENSESDHAKHVRLGLRADDCSGCDPQDCCCQVISQQQAAVNLTFCGTTNPDISTSTCAVTNIAAPCDDITGFSWSALLNGMGDDEFFCVTPGTTFMMGVGGAANLTLSCQYGQATPQVLNLNLSSGEKRYFTANSACELSGCHLE